MIYYEIICHTPYCGEHNYYYVRVKNEKELRDIANDCVVENVNEWYDEHDVGMDYPDIEDYYADCYFTVKEVTAEEYYKNNPWDKEKE